MVTLQITYNDLHINEDTLTYMADCCNRFAEQVRQAVEHLNRIFRQLIDAIKNDARRIHDAITEMLDNYRETIKVEHEQRFYYGDISVRVTDSSFYLPKVNTKPIWRTRRYQYLPRSNC